MEFFLPDGKIQNLGTAPIATTSHPRMAAGQTEYHGDPINNGSS
jgi:hypothetical protein